MASSDRIHHSAMQAITLQQGKFTTHRRVEAIPQLRCVGGSNKCRYIPGTVRCINQGFDGHDIQWECKANLPGDLQFGSLKVICEGYGYPEDPFILVGSCGLEYNIDTVGSPSYKFAPRRQGSMWSRRWIWLGIAVALVWFFFKVGSSPFTRMRYWSSGGNDGHDWWGGSGGRYGFRRNDYPSFGWGGRNDCSGSAQGSGPSMSSLLTGMALGALGGYNYGRSSDTSSGSAYLNRDYHSLGSTRRSRNSGDTFESTGFATTERR